MGPKLTTIFHRHGLTTNSHTAAWSDLVNDLFDGFMACQGFIGPNSAALALGEQGHRLGAASALMGTIQMLCGALAGLAVSAWHSTTPLPLTAVLAGCATLSWLASRTAETKSR